MQKVEVEIGAKDAGSMSAWKRQEYAINGIIEQLGRLEAKQKQAAVQQDGWLTSGIGKLATMAAGAVSVQGAFSYIVTETQRLGQEADSAAAKFDDLFRKVNVQAATLGVAGEAGKQRLLNVALQNASTVEESTAIAKALAGSGFNAEQATGDALAVVLQAQAAMGQQGEGKGGLIAEATAKYLNAMGMEMNGENIKKVLVGMQQSAKAGFGKFEDMAQLSGKVGGFSGKVKSEDVMAAFNIGLLNSASAENAATGLKIFGDRLMGAAGDKERIGLLAKVGLQPEQVDLIGESLDQVMATLDEKLKAMPEAARAPWMQQMFGTEASGFAAKLIENRARMDEFRGVMSNETGFRADVAEMTSGKAAGQRREAVKEEIRKATSDTGFEDKLKVADRLAREQGGWSLMAPIRTRLARQLAPLIGEDRAIGGVDYALSNPFGSVGLMFGARPSSPTEFSRRVNTETEAARASAFEQKEVLKALQTIAENTSKPPVKVERPHVPRTPVSAMAGTGGR